MTAGQFPNQGRVTRGSSNFSRGTKGKRRIGTLYPTALGDEQYTSVAVTANKLLIDYFWAELTVNATAAFTEQADTNTASGTTTVVGTMALTEAADVNDAAGSAGAGGVDGTLALTEQADTNSASGSTTVVGSSALTEGLDVNAAAGTTTVVGTLALTEASDVNASAGTTTVVGTSTLTEQADTNAASGTTTVRGTLALTEAADSFTFTGDAGAAEVPTSGGAARPRMRYERRPLPEPDTMNNDDLAALLVAVLELV